MTQLLKLTQEQFDEATALLKNDSNGYFLEFSLSTDRSEEYETPIWLLLFCEEILTICQILNINIRDLGHFEYDYDDSNHETVNKKIYFLTHSNFKEGYILSTNEIVKEYNQKEHIAVIEDKNDPDNTRTINCFNTRVYNYTIV